MGNVKFKPGSEGMPGYIASSRRINKCGSMRAAWNDLDLFTGAAAEDFLKEKLERLSDNESTQKVALEIILGFGLLAVEAEREEAAALAAVNTPHPPEPRPHENPEEKDIPW